MAAEAQEKAAGLILELEKKSISLQKGVHRESVRVKDLEREIADAQASLLTEQQKQAQFAPAGSVLKREGASSLAIEIKRYQGRVTQDLEKELSRSRRIVDETTRVVAAKREEINLLRKQAMVLNDEFLRRSNELDRAKMQLAIMLEQANQIVKAKQFIGEQVEEIRQEVAKEREVWLERREVVVSEVRRVLNLLTTDSPVRQQARKRLGRSSVVGGGEGKEGDGGINLDMDVGTFDVPSGSEAAEFGALNPAEEARVADRVRKLTALEAALETDAPRQAAQLQQWEDAFLALTDATGESDPDRLVSRFLADDVSNYAVFAATVAMNDEASTLQEQLVRVTADISQALDDANAAKAAQADALRAQLREAEIAAHDAEEREKSLVSEMGAVADKLVVLFRLLNCAQAADEWTKASRAGARAVGEVDEALAGDKETRPGTAALVSAARRRSSLSQLDGMIGGSASASGDASNAWSLLGPDEEPLAEGAAATGGRGAAGGSIDEGDVATSRAGAAHGRATGRDDGAAAGAAGGPSVQSLLRRKKEGNRAPTPPRDLQDLAGLTGTLRGAGFKLLLEAGEMSATTSLQMPAGGVSTPRDADEEGAGMRASEGAAAAAGADAATGAGKSSAAAAAPGAEGKAAAGGKTSVAAASAGGKRTSNAAPADGAAAAGTVKPDSAKGKRASQTKLGAAAAAEVAPSVGKPPITAVDDVKAGGDGAKTGAAATAAAAAGAGSGSPAVGAARAPLASIKRQGSWTSKAGAGSAAAAGVPPLGEMLSAAEEGASPRPAGMSARPSSPLMRAMSARELAAATVTEEDTQTKVPTETILGYLRILERRVQQVCGEFDTVMVTSNLNGGSGSSPTGSSGAGASIPAPRFGARGPRVQRDDNRHAFHIEPPSIEDMASAAESAENGDLAALSNLQSSYNMLRKNRRASLASIVEGVTTAPPGPASAILALSTGQLPTVEARPGTSYSTGKGSAATDSRLSRGELRGRRPSTTAGASESGGVEGLDREGSMYTDSQDRHGAHSASGSPSQRRQSLSRQTDGTAMAMSLPGTAQGSRGRGPHRMPTISASPTPSLSSARASPSPAPGLASSGRLLHSPLGYTAGGVDLEASGMGGQGVQREIYLVERHAGAAQRAVGSGRPNSPLRPYAMQPGGIARSPALAGLGSVADGPPSPLHGATLVRSASTSPTPAGMAAGAAEGGRGSVTVGILPAAFVQNLAAAARSHGTAYEQWIAARMGADAGVHAPVPVPAAKAGGLAGSRAAGGLGASGYGGSVIAGAGSRVEAGGGPAAAAAARRGPLGKSGSTSGLPSMAGETARTAGGASTSRSLVRSNSRGRLHSGSTPLLPTIAGAAGSGAAAAVAGAANRRPRFPKTLYSGYSINSISNYEGAGSQHAYATYTSNSALAARQRIALAAAAGAAGGGGMGSTSGSLGGALAAAAAAGGGGGTGSAFGAGMPSPVDRETLVRDVRRHYGEPEGITEEELLWGPGASASMGSLGGAAYLAGSRGRVRRGSNISQFVHEGPFNEEEHRERQKQREQEQRRQARRRSFEQLEAAFSSAKKASAKIALAEQHKEAIKAVHGTDIELSAALTDSEGRPPPAILGAIIDKHQSAAGSQRRGSRVSQTGSAAAEAASRAHGASAELGPRASADSSGSTGGVGGRPVTAGRAPSVPPGFKLARGPTGQLILFPESAALPAGTVAVAARPTSPAVPTRAEGAAPPGAAAEAGGTGAAASTGASGAARPPSAMPDAASGAVAGGTTQTSVPTSGTPVTQAPAAAGIVPQPTASAPSAPASVPAQSASTTLAPLPPGFAYARAPNGQVVVVPTAALAAAPSEPAVEGGTKPPAA